MTTRLTLLILTLLAFTALSAMALKDVGYFGILAPHFQSWGGAQVFTDLVILALMSCQWMRQDASLRGIPVWPFILITLAAGSFGLLFYLFYRELRSTAKTTDLMTGAKGAHAPSRPLSPVD